MGCAIGCAYVGQGLRAQTSRLAGHLSSVAIAWPRWPTTYLERQLHDQSRDDEELGGATWNENAGHLSHSPQKVAVLL